MARGSKFALCLLVAFGAAGSPALASSGSISNVAALGDGLFSGTCSASFDGCGVGTPCRWFPYATIVGETDDCVARPGPAVIYMGTEHDGPGSEGPVDRVYYSDTE